MKKTLFKDRVHAGRLLAEALMAYADRDDVIVLGLPRGGVPVAYEVAQKLHAPLDVIIVRKLGVPGFEEFAMGAIASGGIQVIQEATVRSLGVPRAAIEQTAAVQLKELQRRELAYRGREGNPEIDGKTVILVDDGIATGSTIEAAARAIRMQAAKKVIIAAPTASPDSCLMLEPLVDEVVTLIRPMDFRAVGQWYENFSQTTDDEVKRLLTAARAKGDGP